MTAKCQGCGSDIEFGDDWIGQTYNCPNCAQSVELRGPESKSKKVAVLEKIADPPKSWSDPSKLELPKPLPGQPSLYIAFGWTWRVMLSVAIIGGIIWFIVMVGYLIETAYVNGGQK
jgi:hypothetical protein